jgi:hypothetical protein
MSNFIEPHILLEDYRAKWIDPKHPNTKPIRTAKVRCDAVDLIGRPVEGDCVVCVSHSFTNGKGYSKMEFGGKPYLLHRLVWELTHKCSIPEGYEVDHICRNRACINPKHLQVLAADSHRLKTLVERGKRHLDLIIMKVFKGEEGLFYRVWASKWQ